MQASTIINKLKKQIQQKGYVENLGQDDLLKYKDYVFNRFSYSKAAAMYQSLNEQIEAL